MSAHMCVCLHIHTRYASEIVFVWREMERRRATEKRKSGVDDRGGDWRLLRGDNVANLYSKGERVKLLNVHSWPHERDRKSVTLDAGFLEPPHRAHAFVLFFHLFSASLFFFHRLLLASTSSSRRVHSLHTARALSFSISVYNTHPNSFSESLHSAPSPAFFLSSFRTLPLSLALSHTLLLLTLLQFHALNRALSPTMPTTATHKLTANFSPRVPRNALPLAFSLHLQSVFRHPSPFLFSYDSIQPKNATPSILPAGTRFFDSFSRSSAYSFLPIHPEPKRRNDSLACIPTWLQFLPPTHFIPFISHPLSL